MIKCNYCEPAAVARWQGTDKTARKGNRHRTGAATKWACDDCKHFLSNPVVAELSPSKREKTTANQTPML